MWGIVSNGLLLREQYSAKWITAVSAERMRAARVDEAPPPKGQPGLFDEK